MSTNKAVVLLSGGLDSTTCLYTAIQNKYQPIAISFDYGQRHRNELEAAKRIAELTGTTHRIIAVDLQTIGGSALTTRAEIPKGGQHLNSEKPEIPTTYVPVRNLIFLSLAYALAETEQCEAIFIGVNAIDYSGYPDCRPDFIAAFANAAALASKAGREGRGPNIFTPLIQLTKAEIAVEARRLGVPLSLTWSCYDPVAAGGLYSPCRDCDACILRRDGFAAAGLKLSNEEIFGAPIEIA
jgi:7-cyano-7-deazaguanine synthase